jgi:hypothetical protein
MRLIRSSSLVLSGPEFRFHPDPERLTDFFEMRLSAGGILIVVWSAVFAVKLHYLKIEFLKYRNTPAGLLKILLNWGGGSNVQTFTSTSSLPMANIFTE